MFVSFKKILIIKPSSMGDVVHSLPVLNAINSTYPSAEIHWLIAKGLEGLLQGHPMIAKLIVVNKDQWKQVGRLGGTISEMGRLSSSLRREYYDVVIDLQGLLRSGIMTALTIAPIRIGFSDAREGSPLFYNRKVEGGSNIHAVNRYLKIAEALDCKTDDIRFPLPLINPSDGIRELTKSLGTYNIIIPGARWQTKRWSAKNFARLAVLLQDRSVIIGGSSDRTIGSELASLSMNKAIDMTGRTSIEDMIYLTAHAQLVISNDTGPMHIAAALKKPVVSIFGPTNPIRTGPYGDISIVVKAGIECAPCYKKTCSKMDCMNIISVQQIYGAVQVLREREDL